MKYEGLNLVKVRTQKLNSTNIKSKNNKFFYAVLIQIIICIITINVLGIFNNSNYTALEKINSIFKVSVSEYPGDAFTKEEKIKFVSQFLFGDALYVSGNSSINFGSPLNSDDVNISDDGIVSIKAKDFSLVCSSASGIVCETGTKSDVKYVEIKHTDNIKTYYSGMDFIGVQQNYVALKSAPLGTIKEGQTLKFYVLYNDENITSSLISNGKIEW